MVRRSAVLAAVLLAMSLPARAQPAGDARVRLASFSAWAAPDRPLTLSVAVTNAGTTPLEDVAVRLTIRQRVRSRSALRAALDGSASGAELASTTEEHDGPIASGQTATIVIQRDLGSLATAFRLGRAQSGVYPIAIDVLTGASTIVELDGAFVFFAAPPESPLNLVWALPIHRPISPDARGQYERATLERELGAGARLRAMADALAAHPAAPLTLAPSGLIADRLSELTGGFSLRSGSGAVRVLPSEPLALAAADLLARLRTVISSTSFELATTPYARARLTALLAAGLTPDAGRQVTAGRERVASLLGREPNPALFVDGGLAADVRSARTVAGLGSRILILDPGSVSEQPEGRFGPDRVVEIRSSRRSFDALLVDGPIRSRLESATQDPALAAMGVLAETASAFFELPALASGRMLVIGTASMPEPSVAAPLLDALTQAPWIRLRTASDAAADPQLRPALEPRGLATAPAAGEDRFVQARAARRTLATLERILVKPSGAEEVASIERLFLASESADHDRNPNAAASLARAARDRARRRLDQISVPSRRVTLTSSGGQIPITVRNGTGYTIRLHVRLDSPRVSFPDGAVRPIKIEGRLGTLTFPLEARGAGSFEILVRLVTPDGQDTIGTGRVRVRSTAVSAVTLMATAGGALFLVGAWARRAITRRPKAGSAS